MHAPSSLDQGAVTSIWLPLQEMGRSALSMLPLIATGAVVFAIFWGAASAVQRVVEKVAGRKSQIPGAATAFGRLAYFALLLVGILIAVTVSFPSVTPAKLFSLLGLGGVAIGFAFKDVFQNLLAGILLLLRQPFRIGDEINYGSFTGAVEAIETRATFIRTYDGRRIIVPNSLIYTEPITVITAYDLLRSEYDIGIGYGDDVESARTIALRALRSVEGVLESPPADVLLWNLAGSTKDLRLRWWTRPQRANVVQLRDQVLQRVAEALAAAGIDLPFPTRVVLFHDQTEAADGDRARQREGWPVDAAPSSSLARAPKSRGQNKSLDREP